MTRKKNSVHVLIESGGMLPTSTKPTLKFISTLGFTHNFHFRVQSALIASISAQSEGHSGVDLSEKITHLRLGKVSPMLPSLNLVYTINILDFLWARHG